MRTFDAWLAGFEALGMVAIPAGLREWLRGFPDEIRESVYFLTVVDAAAGRLVVNDETRRVLIGQVRKAEDAASAAAE